MAQEAEYKRQQEKVSKTQGHIKTTLQEKMQQQVDRQEEQSERQMKLMARADDLMQKLLESREPELSPAERAWVVDVARGEKVVKTFNERRHKVQTQYEILKRRMQEIQGTLSSAAEEDENALSPTESHVRRRFSNAVNAASSDSSDGSGAGLGFGRQSVGQQRQAARRYGTAQLKAVESALSVE